MKNKEKTSWSFRSFKTNTQKLSIKDVIPENKSSEEAKNELNKIKETWKTVDGENLVYRDNEYIYSFRIFRTINIFVRDIYNGTVTLKEADEDKSSLLVEIMNFKKKIKPPNPEKKQKKNPDIFKNLYALFDGRKRVTDVFESKIFQKTIKDLGFSDLTCSTKVSDRMLDKVSSHSNFKILTLKQMLQRLQIPIAQVKVGSKSENLLNESRQIIYSLYLAKEITKKVHSKYNEFNKVMKKNGCYIYEFWK